MAGRFDSVRTKTVHARGRLEAEQVRLRDRRATSPVLDVMFGSAEIHRRAGGGLLAGAIAFRFFLFIVPCVFVVVMVLGIGVDLADTDARHAAREAGIVGLVATAIQAGADATPKAQWVTLVIALIALAFGALNLLRAMLLAHGLIWQVPVRRPRSWARASLLLIATIVGALGVLGLVDRLRELSLIGWLIGLVVYIVIPAGLWLVCSMRWLPTADGATWRELWPGALIFGVGTELLQVVTVVWVARSLEAKSQTYGAIGAALTILVWAYLLGRLVTTAAAVNAALWRARHHAGEPPTPRRPSGSPPPDDAAVGVDQALSPPNEGVAPRHPR